MSCCQHASGFPGHTLLATVAQAATAETVHTDNPRRPQRHFQGARCKQNLIPGPASATQLWSAPLQLLSVMPPSFCHKPHCAVEVPCHIHTVSACAQTGCCAPARRSFNRPTPFGVTATRASPPPRHTPPCGQQPCGVHGNIFPTKRHEAENNPPLLALPNTHKHTRAPEQPPRRHKSNP